MKTLKKRKTLKAVFETTSFSDIIFMLLFFFMVATVLREHEVLVRIKLPPVSELDKLTRKSLIQHVYIGQSKHSVINSTPLIQVNDSFVKIGEVGEAVASLDGSVSEYLIPQVITSLKIDQKVRMGLVTDVKTELRKVGKLKVNYVAVEDKE